MIKQKHINLKVGTLNKIKINIFIWSSIVILIK